MWGWDFWVQLGMVVAGLMSMGVACLMSAVYARGYRNGYRDGRENWRQR